MWVKLKLLSVIIILICIFGKVQQTNCKADESDQNMEEIEKTQEIELQKEEVNQDLELKKENEKKDKKMEEIENLELKKQQISENNEKKEEQIGEGQNLDKGVEISEEEDLEQDLQNLQDQKKNHEKEKFKEEKEKMREEQFQEIQQEQEFLKEWDEKMMHFVADEMLTFKLKKNEEEVFMETVDKATRIRGAYFFAPQGGSIQESGNKNEINEINEKEKDQNEKKKIDNNKNKQRKQNVNNNSSSKGRVDFKILNQKQELILEQRGRGEGIFSLEVSQGEYFFVFSGKKEGKVSFAVELEESGKEHVQSKDLAPLGEVLKDFRADVSELLMESKFSFRKNQVRLDFLLGAQRRMMVLSLGEAVFIFVASVWQVYYIKKILENRSIV